MKQRRGLAAVVGAGSVLFGEAVLAVTVLKSVRLGVLVAAAFVILVAAVGAPVFVAGSVLPAAWLRTRVGPAAYDLTVSDAMLVLGAAVSFGAVPWRDPAIRRVVLGIVAYLAAISLAVIAEPSTRSMLEWCHRLVLALGSVMVGAAVARSGHIARSLASFVGVSCVFAFAAMLEAVRSGFAPAYPLGMHKNAAGFMLLIALLICVIAPTATGLSRRLTFAAAGTTALGLLATQNRGAGVALAVCGAVWGVRQRNLAAPLRAALAAAGLVAVIVVLIAFSAPVESRSQFDSVASRQLTNEYSLDLWRDAPLTGAGIRFFREPDFFSRAATRGAQTFGEPHNVVVSVLAETGIVGMMGFVVLIASCFSALRSTRGALRGLATIVLIARLVESQFGIWWVAGSSTVPFLLIGMCAAMPAREKSADPAEMPVETVV